MQQELVVLKNLFLLEHGMRTLSSSIILSSLVASALLSAVVHAAPSAKQTIPSSAQITAEPGKYEIEANVNVPPKYGRKAAEYFWTPIVGVDYVDITQLAGNFLQSDTHALQNLDNGAIDTDKTELGVAVGLLFDAQYQITATDYWRGGFQTGLVYTSPAKTKFKADVCESTGENNISNECNNGSKTVQQSGSLENSAVQLPLLFTFSRYAASDKYIVTFKLGPVVAYEMYDLDFDHYDIEPENETQIFLNLGIDGRFRLGQSDNFFLIGFEGGSILGGGNNSFSGVDSNSALIVYTGLSFS